ncbi:hypothetical protein CVT24_006820 [Panaeolus cyanescens]|uniref:Uncharacterized protein n=1 Tax=Panaeolus cyanescens TaxID=181874 RepID=A0A409WC15_9AGAR|nr:hypothetical protein CVT24_006820 [Panaeolus cyanescens]
MKLFFHPLLIASIHLALYASIGKTQALEGEAFDLDARDLGHELELDARNLGHDLSDNNGNLHNQPDHHLAGRELFEPVLSSISTRELFDELQDRLERREDLHALLRHIEEMGREFRHLSAIPKKHRTRAQQRRMDELKLRIREARSRYWRLTHERGTHMH